MRSATACILAGGSGRRLGGADKPRLLVGGRPIVEHQRALLSQLCDVKIIGGPDGIPDRRPGEGPLAGLETALLASGGDVLLVGGDMPFLQPDLLRLLLDEPGEAVVPRLGGQHVQPMLSCFAHEIIERTCAALDAGQRSLVGFLATLDTHYLDEDRLRAVDPELLTFFDIDTADDLAEAERIYSAHAPRSTRSDSTRRL